MKSVICFYLVLLLFSAGAHPQPRRIAHVDAPETSAYYVKDGFHAVSFLPVFDATVRIGRIARVYDGDTFMLETIVDGKKLQRTVRLLFIDTPESQKWYTKDGAIQPGGKFVSDTVRALLSGEYVTYREFGVDRFKRPLVIIYHNGVNFNQWLLENGFAWFDAADRKNPIPKPFKIVNGDAYVKAAKAKQLNIFDRARFPDAIKPETFRRNHNR